LSKGARLVVATLYLGWMIGGAAYLLYCAFTYRGVVRWAGEWQMAHLGAYYWSATFILGIAVLILPTYVLVKLFPGSANAPVVVTPQIAPTQAELQKTASRLRRVILWIGLASLAVALISGFIGNQKSNEPVVFEPFDISRTTGEPPEHVELSGIAQTPFIIEHQETINGHTTVHTYVPLTAPGWRVTDPVAYFLRPMSLAYVGDRGTMLFDQRTRPFAVRLKGVLLRNDLPAVVVAGYEKGGLKLAPTIRVLDTQPSAENEIYFLVATPAGILALLSFGVLALVRLVQRRAASGRPSPRVSR
jgi:hypothetical protein